MSTATKSVDELFRALADPTRRSAVHRLAKGPASVSELAAPFDMALPSFVQHMQMLEASGIVRSTKTGRVRTYRLVPKRLQMAEHWLAAQRSMWEQRLDRFEEYVNQLDGSEA
jgi:DNA-binding transcriptional ArsR family regulator